MDGVYQVSVTTAAGARDKSAALPALRFRGKVTLGFAVVLGITAISMGLAYLGFERVSDGVVAYRDGVRQSDLARNIDREMVGYEARARYYVLTGKDEDAKAALAAEARLKDAIAESLQGATRPAQREALTRLSGEFATFAKLFADIVALKTDSALVVQNGLTRGGLNLRYKFDDLVSAASDREDSSAELGAKRAAEQYAGAMTLANTPIRPVRRFDRQLGVVVMLSKRRHLVAPAQIDLRQLLNTADQKCLGVVLLQIDEGRHLMAGLRQQVEAVHHLVAAKDLADLPDDALLDHLRADTEPVPDFERALGKTDRPRALADPVGVVEQHHVLPALRQIDRQR